MTLSFYTYNLQYFPNLLELSFLAVFALPNASKIGLHANIFSDICPSRVNRFMQYLAFSVLPAPLSPDIAIA